VSFAGLRVDPLLICFWSLLLGVGVGFTFG